MNRNILLILVGVIIVGAITVLNRYKAAAPGVVAGGVVPLVVNSDLPAGGSMQKDITEPANPVEKTEKNNSNTMNALSANEKKAKYSVGSELASIAGYINLPEGQKDITLQSLVGKKVIIVDFWTYSCINCQRTLPYINDWYGKYKDQGLEIIGVHTPEFAFEKVYENVKTAVAKYGIKYPVVLDNDYGTWTSYQNRYWPRKYIIDIDGYVVYDHIGEGGYEETERVIQKLLAERAQKLGVTARVDQPLSRPAVEASVGGEISPEIYFGSSRNSYLGNGTSGQSGLQTFTEPAGLKTHILYLAGGWNILPEYAISQGSDSRIIYRYIAKNVFFVAHAGTPVMMEVKRDGKPLTADLAGEDVTITADGRSIVTINEARLYKLVKQGAREEHTLELTPQSAGLEAFTFTFG